MARPPVTGSETFNRVLSAWQKNIRTATPGRIQSYERDTHSADVEPVVHHDGEAPPVLPDRTVFVMGGGASYLAFPHDIGDTGLLIVCDSDIGNWLRGGDAVNPADQARHELAGSVFLPGLRTSEDCPDAPAGATVLAGDDLRLGDSCATKAVVHENLLNDFSSMLSDLATWVSAIDMAIFGVPSPEGIALAASIGAMTVGIGAGSYVSPSVKVED